MTEDCCEGPVTEAGSRLGTLAPELAFVVRGLDVGGLTGPQAAGSTEVFARLERLAGAGKTLAAGRVAETGYYREMGFDTAAHWLADTTKASQWDAARTLDTARHLADESLGVTRDALVAGRLTATQAHEIAGAAARAPGEQEGLLALAARETTGQLKNECRRIRLVGKKPEDPEDRRKRIVEEMAFGHCDLGDGLSELFARMPTSWLVLSLAAVRQQCDEVFAKAKAQGRQESHQAYMVEALVTLLLFGEIKAGEGPFAGDADADAEADGGDVDERNGRDGADASDEAADAADADAAAAADADDAAVRPAGDAGMATAGDLHDQLLATLDGAPLPTAPPRRGGRGRCRCGGRVVPKAKIIVRVDQDALVRGCAGEGEVCDIAGVGPVPVATVRELWPDAVVKLVVTRGVDVVNVTHLGRRATEAMATALQWTNPRCSNIGCDHELFVEIDHRLGFANVARTRLGELDALCRGCHGLKSTQNWQLVRGSGRRQFVPPGHRDHPGDPATPRWRAEAMTA